MTKTQNNVKVVRVERSVVFRASKLFHFLFCVGLFVCAWNRYCFENSIDIANRYNVFVYVLYGVLLFFFIRTYNACLIEYMDTIDTLISLSLATSISDGFIYILTAIVWEKFYYPWIFLVLIAVQIVCNFIWADVTIRLFHHKYRPLKTVVIYKNKSDLKQLQDIRRFYRKFNIVKYFENPLKTEVLDEINDLKAIILAGVTADFRNKTAEYCVKRNIHFFFLPQVGDVIIKGGGDLQAFSIPLVEVRRKVCSPEYIITKRLFDLLMSSVMLLVLSPVIFLTALAVKFCDGGSVFYRQVRLTKDGKKFNIIKFRSMRSDAESDGVARLSTGEHDNRITSVGKFIRAIHIDELPQLFNVLRGDMSLVGPRPERPEIAEQYEKKYPSFSLRLQVKAGITGYAQVFGRYNTDPYDKLEMDLLYVNRMSILLDVRLLFATLRILFNKENSAGIDDGNTTALQNDD